MSPKIEVDLRLKCLKLIDNFIDINEFKKVYKLCRLIGKGAFGCVYSGFRFSDRLFVAVKHIDKHRVTDWRVFESNDILKRIPIEIYLLEKLQSVSGVIKLLEWYETEHSYLIVMERPEHSMDLFELSRKKPNHVFSEIEVKIIFKQIIQTLRDCLRLGLVHRDVKPENILISTENYMTKLIDFGAGGHVYDNIGSSFRGTIPYCPPEYFTNKSFYGEPQTVWSLGILLFELICGYLPYETEEEVLHNKNGLKFSERVSKEFKQIIGKCLSRKPTKRPTINDLFSNQMFNNFN